MQKSSTINDISKPSPEGSAMVLFDAILHHLFNTTNFRDLNHECSALQGPDILG
jgi:hypothetical protein